jgi:hypothetical protein
MLSLQIGGSSSPQPRSLFDRASAPLTSPVEPAHNVTRANDFMALAALYATFSCYDFQLTRILTYVERPDPAHFVSCIDEPKSRENETKLSLSEMNRFAVQVLTH